MRPTGTRPSGCSNFRQSSGPGLTLRLFDRAHFSGLKTAFLASQLLRVAQ